LKALVQLGAKTELVLPLRHFLGVPDPLPGGLGAALGAGVLEQLGGPSRKGLARLRERAELGQAVDLFIPKGGNDRGVRLLIRAQNRASVPRQVRLSPGNHLLRYDIKGELVNQRNLPLLDAEKTLLFELPPNQSEAVERSLDIPASWGLRAGRAVRLIAQVQPGVELEALAVLPLQDEIPPPEAEPWKPADSGMGGGAGGGDGRPPSTIRAKAGEE
jgi:hypothetical protein